MSVSDLKFIYPLVSVVVKFHRALSSLQATFLKTAIKDTPYFT